MINSLRLNDTATFRIFTSSGSVSSAPKTVEPICKYSINERNNWAQIKVLAYKSFVVEHLGKRIELAETFNQKIVFRNPSSERN